MAKQPLGLRLDPALIARIDEARKKQPRTAWIEAAIMRHLMARPGETVVTTLPDAKNAKAAHDAASARQARLNAAKYGGA